MKSYKSLNLTWFNVFIINLKSKGDLFLIEKLEPSSINRLRRYMYRWKWTLSRLLQDTYICQCKIMSGLFFSNLLNIFGLCSYFLFKFSIFNCPANKKLWENIIWSLMAIFKFQWLWSGVRIEAFKEEIEENQKRIHFIFSVFLINNVQYSPNKPEVGVYRPC